MVVDILLTAAVFILAFAIYKGNFTVTVVHKHTPAPVEELKDLREEMMRELTQEETKFYEETTNLITEINQLIYGKEEKDGEPKELK